MTSNIFFVQIQLEKEFEIEDFKFGHALDLMQEKRLVWCKSGAKNVRDSSFCMKSNSASMIDHEFRWN